ncbi:AAA family ATPase [Rarobacter faecitabidus]|uniref:DNA helicase IV n=1 Tax=Rarobacter faecitabidus TaxID=13243 RepID=A0A542ZWD2_RARFA|nr:AAA family ATPase [Rarobacter faecitabidus]TQL64632.1 DNA helicase IV [Rarobacter faecitabidus]
MSDVTEFDREQRAIDRFYERLDHLRLTLRDKLAQVRRAGPSGSPQNRSERDAFATMYEDRVAHLESVEERLCFGRLDFDSGDSRYVGRIGLTDEGHHTILTDWRAPAAEPFYQATAEQRDGVWRRRHLLTSSRKLTGIEDDLLDLEREDDGKLAGEGALMAALARGRTEKMRDIVSTIQREQDRIIRSPLAGALVVQGGPGTGKTAVALHRAAYLLYAHRSRLERSGVLLVGPSRTFLRYIDQVLPSLGETGVVSTTIAGLIPHLRATETDSPLAAEAKGSRQWVKAIERAVRARQRVPEVDVPFDLDGHGLVIRRGDVSDAIARARRTHRPHNEARESFVRDMLRRLTDQYLLATGQDLDSDFRSLATEDLRSHPTVRRELNLAWFPISAERLIKDLFAKPHRLAEAAPFLSPRQREALLRPTSAGWSIGDIPLLDEALDLLGPIDGSTERDETERGRAAEVKYARQVLESSGAGAGIVDAETLAERFAESRGGGDLAERAAHDRSWVYGHVVVDEAQELSEMAWHSLARRCPTRSFTIVGDVAQASSAAGTRDWRARLGAMFGRHLHLESLTVNYRTPRLVSDLAMSVARHAGLPVSPLTSARDVPDCLEIQRTSRGASLSVALDSALTEANSRSEGTIAIVTLEPELAAPWLAAHADEFTARDGKQRLTIATPGQVKGLEFDVVVVHEPARILSAGNGAADLFVALSRPTQRLIVVHSDPLPRGFSQ